jgi:hypothetical protein
MMPSEIAEEAYDCSTLLDGQIKYLNAIFVAIQEVANTKPAIAVDLAELGQWVAENTRGNASHYMREIIQASKDIH